MLMPLCANLALLVMTIFNEDDIIKAACGMQDTSGFMKFDSKKKRPRLLPLVAIDRLLDVLEYGAQKYKEENWRKCEDLVRYYDAALRHLFAWKSGELIDEESGLPHIAHALTCLAFMAELGPVSADEK